MALEPDTQRDDGWSKYSVSLPANSTISKADYTISLNTLAANETVDIDMVSMFPAHAVNGIFHRDMAESIKDINPGFLRFPGGCVVEGYDLINRYQWKDTVGPIESRPKIWNRWTNKSDAYNETYGLGFYEYFILCEYLNCKVLPILNVGLACEFNTSEAVPVFESDNKTYTAEFQTYI